MQKRVVRNMTSKWYHLCIIIDTIYIASLIPFRQPLQAFRCKPLIFNVVFAFLRLKYYCIFSIRAICLSLHCIQDILS